MEEPQVVLEDSSPHGNMEAVVEQDERVAYLYVRAPERPDLKTKSCWVRNLGPAPEVIDLAGMGKGLAPMLPRENCAHPAGKEPLNPARLQILWFPEGDGVGLLEDGEMLALIPAWGFANLFPGYARDAIGESKLCWELGESEVMNKRIDAAKRYWNAWAEDAVSLWKNCQGPFVDDYERVLGPHDRYYSIDDGYWPPKAMIRRNRDEGTYLLTLGVCLRPQPQVEMHYEDPSDFRRIEIAACLAPGLREESIARLSQFISGMAALPWMRISFLGHGHTLPCDAFANDPELRHFTAVLLVDHPPGAPEFNPPRMDGDRVMLLWVVPITDAERNLIVEKRSAEFISRFPADWPLHVIAKRPAVL